jgi:hypothetical protein
MLFWVALCWLMVAVAGRSREREEDGWKEVAPDDLPAAVARTLRTEFPKEDIDRAFAGLGRDRGRFRVVMRFGSGERLGVELDTDGTVLAARDLSNELSVKDLPPKVSAALKSEYPGAELFFARKARLKEQETYEVTLRHDRRLRTVAFGTEGKVLLVRSDMRPDDLPAAVARALKEKVPGVPVRRTVEIAENGKVTAYEVVVRPAPDGAALRLRYAPDGRLLEEVNVERPGFAQDR